MSILSDDIFNQPIPLKKLPDAMGMMYNDYAYECPCGEYLGLKIIVGDYIEKDAGAEKIYRSWDLLICRTDDSYDRTWDLKTFRHRFSSWSHFDECLSKATGGILNITRLKELNTIWHNLHENV